MSLKVLITGATRGIGKAIALLLQEDYTLLLHGTALDKFTALRGELTNPEKHTFLCSDLSTAQGIKELCSELKKHSDTLYAVVNNAGITIDKSLLFQPESDVDAMINVNLKAPILISKTAFKIFNLKNEGVIINMGSCVGESGNAFQSIYSATKAGLTAFSKSLAREAGALKQVHNIRVLSIAPGFIETDMTANLPEAEKQKYLSGIPSKRLGQPNDVASLVKFLLSNSASYINGSEIKINGGII